MDATTKERLADFICRDDGECYPICRSSTYFKKFFQDLGINKVHDGSTRKWWVLGIIQELKGPDLQNLLYVWHPLNYIAEIGIK
jgi:hypothetical protein